MGAIQSEKCTAVHGVPTMFISMLDHPDFDKYDFSTLRTGIMAGSPCPIEFMKRAMSDMNMQEKNYDYIWADRIFTGDHHDKHGRSD